jgi:hypothetical protein
MARRFQIPSQLERGCPIRYRLATMTIAPSAAVTWIDRAAAPPNKAVHSAPSQVARLPMLNWGTRANAASYLQMARDGLEALIEGDELREIPCDE